MNVRRDGRQLQPHLTHICLIAGTEFSESAMSALASLDTCRPQFIHVAWTQGLTLGKVV